MTFKTLLATAAVALVALVPAASAEPMPAPAAPVEAKWQAYDQAIRAAYTAEPAAAPAKRVAPTIPERDVPTGTRVVLAFLALGAVATIVAIRRRDRMFRPATGGWDM